MIPILPLVRATALLLAFFGPLPPLAPSARAAEAGDWRHGLSLYGDLKYPADFKHFDYVNPSAPKAGTVRLQGQRTFDNFNPVVASVKGNIGAGVELIYDTLLVSAYDEVSTAYGLLAEAVTHPADFSSVSYRLRPNAKWHDGVAVSPEDVIFSFEVTKQYSPQLAAYYRHVAKVEKTGEREITFTFDAPGNRELPQIVGQLTIFPKHWWDGTDATGRRRDIGATTLEPPLGAGAYRIKSFDPGRNIVYERVKDYWGKDLPVNVGRDNFEEIRFEYFRDSGVALEAFKADQLDYRVEAGAKDWATAYDFPAVRDRRVLKQEFPQRSLGVMQAFVFNTRRDKFKDPRLRRAFDLVFDFDEMNKALFFGQYHRISSYFEGTELAWNAPPPGEEGGNAEAPPKKLGGPPQGLEREILESVRDKVPPSVFEVPYVSPKGGSPEATRTNLREALRLAKEAGYEVRDRRLVSARTGEQLTVEFLVDDPRFERVVLFYKPSLERLGVGVTVRVLDEAQYENRLRGWDFDMIISSWGESLSPGNEQRGFWGSQAADTPGSRNLIGIKDAGVDALIERVIFTTSREELVAATKALDRVLMAHNFVVPNWTYGKTRTARWDRFGRPDTLPRYFEPAFPTVWWWDAERAAKLGARP